MVRSDSTYRSAFLPLDLVSSRFSSDKAVEWVKQFSKLENGAELVNEIAARGITSGLHRYGSGKLALLHEQFDALNEKLGKRLTIDEVSQFHMTWLNEWLLDSKTFFQSLWDGVRKECLSIGVSEKRYPLLYWLQRLKTHFDQAKPPVNPFRPSHGVQIFRLQQAPSLSSCDHLWFLGLQRAWLEPDSFGDYWFSSREREFLSSEFQIRSVHDIRSERRNIVKAWISIADQATVLELSLIHI